MKAIIFSNLFHYDLKGFGAAARNYICIAKFVLPNRTDVYTERAHKSDRNYGVCRFVLFCTDEKYFRKGLALDENVS